MKKRSFYLILFVITVLGLYLIIYKDPRNLTIFRVLTSKWGIIVLLNHPVFLSTLIGVSLGLVILKRKITLFSFSLFTLGVGIIIFGNPQARPPTNSVNAATKPVVPFSYLKGNYKGNIKGTWKYYGEDTPYKGVDYSVDGDNNYPIKTYCGLNKDAYIDSDSKYYTLNNVQLFGGAIKMQCNHYKYELSSGDICDIYHPIATDAHIRIAFNTSSDVPKEQWDSFFADFAKYVENEIPKDEMPDIEQICEQLKNQSNQLPTKR
jgi:hypothetical protein